MSKIYIIGVICSFVLCLSCKKTSVVVEEAETVNYTSYVDPFIGTDSYSNSFPGASFPFGRIQLSPDTHLSSGDTMKGYHYSDSIIYGFSHTHSKGTNSSLALADILLLPYSGNIPEHSYSSFRHETEIAKPGYYSVFLDDFKIKCELSATKRSGWHNYTYPINNNAGLLIDISHLVDEKCDDSSEFGWLKILNNKTILGYKANTTGKFENPVWFKIKFNAPFQVRKKQNFTVEGNSEYDLYGKDIRLWVSFGVLQNPLTTCVTFSSVDASGPAKNMDALDVVSSFDSIVVFASNEWEKELSEIQIKSKDDEVLTNFYTSLYQTKLVPNVISDIDGRYLGVDRKVHKDAYEDAFSNFNPEFTYNSWFPLMTIIEPDLVSDIIYSMFDAYKEGGRYPGSTTCRLSCKGAVAYPSVAIIADALSKHIIDSITDELIDAAEVSASISASQINLQTNLLMGNQHAELKNKFGFIPADKVDHSVSWGLQMAYNDWCVGNLKELKGNDELAKEWYRKAQLYRHYFDASKMLMNGKNIDGSWNYPQFNLNGKRNFTYGNSYQWANFVPHDISGLRELYGGKEAMANRLDSLFMFQESVYETTNDQIGLYNHANYANQHVPYLYNYTNRPFRTSEVVDSILYALYDDTPNGVVNSEDFAQNSAWYVLSSLGFYQICPGRPVYDIGRPLIDEAKIKVENGWFTITVHNNAPNHKYVDKVLVNNEEILKPSFNHNVFKAGGKMELFMEASYKNVDTK